jgi:hypothetical protein
MMNARMLEQIAARERTGILLALVGCVLVPLGAHATDHLLAGRSLALRDKGSTVRLKYAAMPPVPWPASADPQAEAATIRVFNPEGVEDSGLLECPPEASTVNEARTVFKCRNSGSFVAPCDQLSLVVLKSEKLLKVKGRCLGALTLDEPSQGGLEVVLSLGGDRYCSSFTGASVVRDDPGSFKAKNAPPPAGPTCSDPPPKPTGVKFTTFIGSGVCGTVKANDGSVIQNLECGGVYFGGGNSSMQLPVRMPEGNFGYAKASCTDSSCGQLEVSPARESDVPGPGCPAAQGTPSHGMRHCTAGDCYVGAPMAAPNGPLSKCGLNRVPAAGSIGGLIDPATGEVAMTFALDTEIYITGNATQACPGCVGGTLGACGSGTCQGGPNAGLACTPEASGPGAINPTSHDCPPDGQYMGRFLTYAYGLLLTTDTQEDDSGGTGLFCPGQHGGGAFSLPDARALSVQGSPPGNLLDELPHPGIFSSIFCVPKTGNVLIDGTADLPGPGASAIAGSLQLLF